MWKWKAAVALKNQWTTMLSFVQAFAQVQMPCHLERVLLALALPHLLEFLTMLLLGLVAAWRVVCS